MTAAPGAQDAKERGRVRGTRAPIVFAAALWTVFVLRGFQFADGTWYYSLFDDAMVSMRYAQNAAQGDGFVWNAGQPPVEGYTNPLWTAWMTVLHLTHLPPAAIALLVALSGLAILVATLFVVRSICRRVAPDQPRVAVGALWLVATFFPLAYWTLRGMEVGLVALVLTATIRVVLDLDTDPSVRRLGAVAALSAIGVWTRSDTAVFLLAIAVVYVVANAKARTAPVIGVLFGVPVLAFVANTGLRLLWYGELVPITYTLKVGGASLAQRAERGSVVVAVAVLGQLLVVIALAVAGAFRADRRDRGVLALLGAPLAAALAYCIWTGGDAWEWMNFADRFVSSASPALMIAGAWGASILADSLSAAARERLLRWAIVGLVVASAVFVIELLPTESLLAEAGSGANQARAFGLFSAVIGIVVLLVLLGKVSGARQRQRFFVGLIVIAIISGGLSPWWDWVPNGGREMLSDKREARTGTLLGEALPPGTSIAVTHAGNLVYFSGLPGNDILGKSDKFVSTTTPHAFYPGHGKWDFEYSIGRLHPDVILEFATPFTAAEVARLDELGYEQLTAEVWFDPTRVDRAALESAVHRGEWDQPSVSGT